MGRFYLTIIILISATFVNYGFSKPEACQNHRSLKGFPKVMGEWKAIDEQEISEGSMAVLQVDDYVMRTYSNSNGETIGLYIGYFKTQREGKQIHSPRQCLPGAGWNILEHREYSLALKEHDPPTAKINLHVVGKGDDRQLYLWWYHGRGRIYASEYMNKLYLIWDAMTKRRTDGALVRVNMSIASNLDRTLEAQINFTNMFVPMLSEYIPN